MMKRVDLGITNISFVITKGLQKGTAEVMTWKEDDRVDVNLSTDDVTNTISMTKLQAKLLACMLEIASEEL